MVAGYCWKWVSKKQPVLKDIVIGDYKATWNLDSDGQAWIIKPDSVSEVGCIHTCQGLEVDYIGVIIGPDLIVRDGKVITQPGERASTDKSIHGWKKAHMTDPTGTDARLVAIIKNTYRTLMTRGQKGCYVYFTDDETRRYFESRIELSNVSLDSSVAVPPIEETDTAQGEPFRRLALEDVRPFENCVPLYDLEVAAGQFSEEQQITDVEWVELPDIFRPKPGLFVTRVVGESMNRRIPNGSWCLFRMRPEGTRQGKVILVRHRDITDADTGGHYTVKVYESKKEVLPDGTWRHSSIILWPDTRESGYEPIVLSEERGSHLEVIGELIAVLG
jgi:DUF2075 family protein